MFNPSEYANNGASRDIAQFSRLAAMKRQYEEAQFNRQLTLGALEHEKKGGDPREYVQAKRAERDQYQNRSWWSRLGASVGGATEPSDIEKSFVAKKTMQDRQEVTDAGNVRKNELVSKVKNDFDRAIGGGATLEQATPILKKELTKAGLGKEYLEDFLMPYFQKDIEVFEQTKVLDKKDKGRDEADIARRIRVKYPDLASKFSQFGIKAGALTD